MIDPINDIHSLGGLNGYFHQDWVDEFDNWEQVVDQFIDDKRPFPDDLRNAVLGVGELVNGGFSEEELEDFFTEVDWNYRPAAHNETHVAWLQSVLARLENQTGIKAAKAESTSTPTSPSLSGVTGNASDDRLRRREYGYATLFYRFAPTLIAMLVIGTLWEVGYRATKKAYAGTGVEISRFGGFQSMLRQLFGVKPRVYRNGSPQSLAPEKSKRTYVSAQSSRAQLVAHHKPPGGDEEFVFEINLYKKDGWFETGIPIIVGNLVWAYTPNEEPNAAIVARIAGNSIKSHPRSDTNPSPDLSVVIVNHEVEYEHVVLRSDQIEHLALKLEGSPTHEPVRLFVRVSLMNINGASEETKQRQIALIEHSSNLAVR